MDDGWILNERGEPFVKGSDRVRYKQVDGQLMGLILKWGKMQDSVAASLLQDMLLEPLFEIGIRVEVTEVPFVQLLQHYYRQVDRTYDMMYLATNFISIFDPYFVFNTADAFQGPQNTTGFRDGAGAAGAGASADRGRRADLLRAGSVQAVFQRKAADDRCIRTSTSISRAGAAKLQPRSDELVVALLHATFGRIRRRRCGGAADEEIEIVG